MSIYGNNRTLLREGGSWSNSSYMPLDCLIEAARTDMAIFDEVIGNDFYHAYSEAGLIYVTEDDDEKKDDGTKKSIWTRIKDFFKGIWESIKKLFGKVKDKASGVINNDKELYKKSGELVRKNGAGKKISTKYDSKVYEIQTKDNIGGVSSNDLLDSVKDYEDKIKDALENSETSDEFNEKIKKEKEEADKVFKEAKESYDSLFKENDKSEDLEMTQKMVDVICDNIQAGMENIVNILESNYKIADATIKKAEKVLDLFSNAANVTSTSNDDEKKDKDTTISMMNAASKAFEDVGKILLNTYNTGTNYMTKIYTAQRSAFSSLASQCSEKKDEKKEEAKGESVEAWALGQLSDIYMEQAFNFY